MEQQNQQPIQEKMESKRPIKTNWKFIAIVVVVGLLVGVGTLWYTNSLRVESQTPQVIAPRPTRSPTPIEIDTSTWQTYQNSEFGFEVRYPRDWKVNFENKAKLSQDPIEDGLILVEIASIDKNSYLKIEPGVVPSLGGAKITILRKHGRSDRRSGIEYSYKEGTLLHDIEVRKNPEGNREFIIEKQYWKDSPEALGFESIFDQMLTTFRFINQDMQKLIAFCFDIEDDILGSRFARELCWQEVASIAEKIPHCENIPYEMIRNSCYGELAVLHDDTTLCEKMGVYAYTCKISVALAHPFYNEEEAKSIIADLATRVMRALKEKDMETLASFVHSQKPLRFWSINASFEVSREKLPSFFIDKTLHTGAYDGSGLPFTFTQAEHYERYVYDRDYLHAPEVSYRLSFISSATTLGDQFERYYEENPITATYSFPQSSDEAAFDWRNLRLWFTEENGIWYLREIMQNQWAI